MTSNHHLRISLLALYVLGLAACTPTHTVRPLPEFVKLALAPGDAVEITTHDGKTFDLTLSAVEADALEGDGQRIALSDIKDIQKRAWDAPPLPCGGEKPVGCSVPWLIKLTSDTTSHYMTEFHDACVQHDFCYRHGARSYGHTRDDCDAEFLDNMLATCPAPARGVISKTLDLLDDAPTSRRVCLDTAQGFHSAIRHFGEKHFLSDQSTYCEYDGPPFANAPSSASPDL
ncbi:MAG: hypothetical protein AB8G16_18360 [Gammaproteobacteria bacterium]